MLIGVLSRTSRIEPPDLFDVLTLILRIQLTLDGCTAVLDTWAWCILEMTRRDTSTLQGKI